MLEAVPCSKLALKNPRVIQIMELVLAFDHLPLLIKRGTHPQSPSRVRLRFTMPLVEGVRLHAMMMISWSANTQKTRCGTGTAPPISCGFWSFWFLKTNKNNPGPAGKDSKLHHLLQSHQNTLRTKSRYGQPALPNDFQLPFMAAQSSTCHFVPPPCTKKTSLDTLIVKP